MGIKFWKAKPKSEKAGQRMDNSAAFIANGITEVQMGWAKWMNRKTEKISAKSKVILLIIFCALSLSLSFLIVFRNLNAKGDQIQIAVIRRPLLPNKKDIAKPDTAGIRNIIKFRQYMDSLSKDSNGKKTFDSIQNTRPGLLDSIATVEKLYNKN